MTPYADDVTAGRKALEDWLVERLPKASVRYIGTRRGDFHGWIADFGPGEPGLRLGALERVLSDEGILNQRLRDLDIYGWLEDVEEQSKWVLLNAVGVTSMSRDDW